MEHRNSGISSHSQQPIFDVQTFQNQLELVSPYNSSKSKRMSFSEYSCNSQYRQVAFKGSYLILKE